MDTKPKIAVIGLKGLPAFGGAAAVGENIIEQLKDKYDFTVYATSSHTDREGDMGGFQQLVFQALPFKKLNTLYYYILSALHAVFLDKFDLVHLHHRDAAFLLLILKIKYKTIITTHGSFKYRPKWVKFKPFFQINEKFFVKLADIKTCVSKEEKRLYKNKLNLNFHYIPNGINITENDIQGKLEKIDNYIFFGAGRIIKTKGLDILLRSLKKAKIDIPLYVAGDLEQQKDYKEEILKLSKGLNVKFLGLIKEKNILLNYLKKAKLFVFPSSYEAMSMMLIEAVSTQVPILASDITQNKDIFSDKEVLFFKTDDFSDLSKKLHFALNNYEVIKRMASDAYERCTKNYNWTINAKEYHKCYDKLITHTEKQK